MKQTAFYKVVLLECLCILSKQPNNKKIDIYCRGQIKYPSKMLSIFFAFFTSLFCVACIVIIELFHIEYMKQQNGIVVWKAANVVANKMDSMLNVDAHDLEPQPPLDSPV